MKLTLIIASLALLLVLARVTYRCWRQTFAPNPFTVPLMIVLTLASIAGLYGAMNQ